MKKSVQVKKEKRDNINSHEFFSTMLDYPIMLFAYEKPACFRSYQLWFYADYSLSTAKMGNKIAEILNNYSDSRDVEIMFSDDDSYSEAVENLFENGEIWKFVDSGEVTYAGDDSMYILRTSNICYSI